MNLSKIVRYCVEDCLIDGQEYQRRDNGRWYLCEDGYMIELIEDWVGLEECYQKYKVECENIKN